MPSTDWWLQSGTTSTAEGPAMQGQSNQIRETEIADGAVTAAKIGALAVTAAKIGAGAVLSQKLSTNAVTRFVTLPLASTRNASSSAGYDSGNTIWYPTHALTISAINFIANKSWVNTTCEVAATIYRNSSSSVADLTLTSTAIVAGSRVAADLTANLDIAANSTLSMKWSYSTCSEPSNATIQVSYVTTG